MNGTSEITFNLLDINELLRLPFSPTRKRMIKNDAEEFIVEEAEALPSKGAIKIKINFALSEIQQKDDIAPAIHMHFCYRRERAQKRHERMLQYGWRILFTALGLLALIFTLTELATWLAPDNRLVLFIREYFVILGWVVLWRPIELLLYDRYPVKRMINLFRRLEQSAVQVIVNEQIHSLKENANRTAK